jgi:hypothetical protein
LARAKQGLTRWNAVGLECDKDDVVPIHQHQLAVDDDWFASAADEPSGGIRNGDELQREAR